MGFEGWPESSWERIALGVVRDIQVSQVGGLSAQMLFDDLVTATRQRFDPDATTCALFATQPASTTLSASYSAGDSSITVASATNFYGRTSGLLRMVPTSGDPFYLRYTNVSGTTVTVSTTTSYGTTASSMSGGDQVYICAWISGHPLNIVHRILASRDGTNGPQDVLPEAWGLGITDTLIDGDDIGSFRDVVWVATSGSYEWDVVEEAAADDAYGWLVALLSPAGGFLAMRQGRITARCAQRPTYSCGLPITPIAASDRMSDTGWRYNAFSSLQRVEYCASRVHSYTTFTDTTAGDSATMPVERRKDHDLSAVLISNETACRQGDVNRLSIYNTRIPERITMPLPPVYATLCPGDLVDLDTTGVPTRAQLRGATGVQLGVVDEVSVDWSDGVVSIGVIIHPSDEEVLT
jgi:hypothetical protein